MFYDCTPKNVNNMEKYAYGVQFTEQLLKLHVAVPENESTDHEKTLYWLTHTFFPKFYKWAINDKGSKPVISSLSHVCVKMYCQLYGRLKEKYAKSLMDVSCYIDTILDYNNNL